MRLIIVNKSYWGLGLQWFTPSGKPNLRAETERLELNLKSAVRVCLQKPLQYGLGELTQQENACSLAAVLRGAHYSLLGSFHLEHDGQSFWWVCAIRQGLISAQGDKVCSSAEEAQAHCLLLRDLLGDFEQSIVCSTDAESRAWLQPCLPTSPFLLFHRARLFRVHGGERLRTILLAGGVGLGLCAGLYLLQSTLEQRASHKAMEQVRLALLDKEKRRTELLAAPEEQFSQAWQQGQEARYVLARCLSSMLGIPTTINGWILDQAVCDGDVISTEWLHSASAHFDQLPLGGRLHSPQLVRAQTRLSRSAQRARPPVPWQSLPSQSEASKKLYHTAQTIGLRASMPMQPVEKKIVDEIEVVSPWLRGTWELSGLPAMLLLDMQAGLGGLLAMPGLCLNTVTLKKDLWTLKGTLYVLP